jgi:HSP20 family protein
MAIVRWDPFREVVSLQNRLNSLFQDYGRGQNDGDTLTAASFAPPVDIYEDDHKLVLKLEVPGVKQEDLDIQVERREAGKLPSRRAPLRHLRPQLHSAGHR